jgi:hypothetical protein
LAIEDRAESLLVLPDVALEVLLEPPVDARGLGEGPRRRRA